jgi:hypothetical protein
MFGLAKCRCSDLDPAQLITPRLALGAFADTLRADPDRGALIRETTTLAVRPHSVMRGWLGVGGPRYRPSQR